jgi:hypothetical protein
VLAAQVQAIHFRKSQSASWQYGSSRKLDG